MGTGDARRGWSPAWGSLAMATLLASLCPVSGAAAQPARPGAGPYVAEVTKWRADREAKLTAEDGWLSVAGLFFLKPGPNAFGSGPANDIVLPRDTTAEKAGVFQLKEGRVFFEMAENVEATLNGRPAARGELAPGETDRAPDVLRLGRLALLVHRSGPRLAIRLRDPEGPVRKTFTSTRWYGIDPTWKLTGRYVPYEKPRIVRIVNLLGDEVELTSPGVVRFTRDGHAYSLVAVLDEGEFWFIFTDRTAGRDTYKAARFLYAPLPAKGEVVLDFNKAYNPPCAYSPYTTCPLPPKENRLDLAVTAGERLYPGRWEPR